MCKKFGHCAQTGWVKRPFSLKMGQNFCFLPPVVDGWVGELPGFITCNQGFCIKCVIQNPWCNHDGPPPGGTINRNSAAKM